MKVPPKRKGNAARNMWNRSKTSLNESPSEKEGKFFEQAAEVTDHRSPQ